MSTPIKTPGFAHVAGMTAAEVCRRFELSPAAEVLLDAKDTPERLYSLLLANGLHEDAIRLVAHSQPRKELVQWTLACAQVAYAPAVRPAEKEALAAVEAWLAEPKDARRKAAFEASEKARMDNPAGLLAAAVFFTGGNIAPPEAGQETPAPAGVAAQLAAAAVSVAASYGDPSQHQARMALFLTPVN
jgi:hypothetical protein